MTPPHADPYAMVQYARGDLQGEAADELLAHCESCRDCGDQLAVALLLRRRRRGMPVVRPRRRSWQAVAAAAVLVLGLGLGALLLAGDPASEAGPGSATAPGVSAAGAQRDAGAPPGVADLAVREVSEGWIGLYEMILERSGGVAVSDGTVPVTAAIREAIAALRSDAPAEAVRILTPCCGPGHFHVLGSPVLGVALLLEGEDLDRAAAVLEMVIDARPDEEGLIATWFLAQVRLLQERPEAALRLLDSMESGEPYHREAVALAERLRGRLGAARPAPE